MILPILQMGERDGGEFQQSAQVYTACLVILVTRNLNIV